MKKKISSLCSTILLAFFFCQYAYSENYQFLSLWGDQRPDLSQQLNKPRGVAVDNNGYVYVSETYSNRIVKYNSNGNILKTWSDCNGSPINYPMEIAVDGKKSSQHLG